MFAARASWFTLFATVASSRRVSNSSIPYTQQAVSRLLVELARAAGLLGAEDGEIDRMHPHRLRHTFVTILLDRGQGLATVQDAARHASADTTRLYDRRRDAYRTHPTHELIF